MGKQAVIRGAHLGTLATHDGWESYGWFLAEEVRRQIRAMTYPVRCRHCQAVYDGGAVEVTARYLDASVYKTPCCGITADERDKNTWRGHFYEIDLEAL